MMMKLLGRFFFSLSLPDRNLETSMRIHFHDDVDDVDEPR